MTIDNRKPADDSAAASKIMRVLLVIVLVIVSLPFVYLAALQLEAQGYVPYIQAAIDAQCEGQGIVVSAGGYSGDPIPSWGSPEASCSLDLSTDSFVCSCEPVP